MASQRNGQPVAAHGLEETCRIPDLQRANGAGTLGIHQPVQELEEQGSGGDQSGMASSWKAGTQGVIPNRVVLAPVLIAGRSPGRLVSSLLAKAAHLDALQRIPPGTLGLLLAPCRALPLSMPFVPVFGISRFLPIWRGKQVGAMCCGSACSPF